MLSLITYVPVRNAASANFNLIEYYRNALLTGSNGSSYVPDPPVHGEFDAARNEWRERAVVVRQDASRPPADALDEMRLLVQSAGAEICGQFMVVRRKPVAATFIGSGKVDEIKEFVEAENATLVAIDHAITPIQERNLERRLQCRVLDRTGLILDIFAQRATSHEGKLQVELAQLRHLSTRLVRGWTHLERQKGGIGLRGPGETQLETDRRLIGRRIKTLTQKLSRVNSQRQLRRRSRNKVPIPIVSLVGYTNAGKSSLFNHITESNVYAADKLFATLDPTMRRVDIAGFGPIILSDTVGFIRGLPHGLVSAFHSTLEEVVNAALLIHVVDVAHPDHDEYMEQVNNVLAEIGAGDVPILVVFNKIDTISWAPDADDSNADRSRRIWLSAHTGAGVDTLLHAIGERLGSQQQCYGLRIPPAAGRLRARLYGRGRVVSEETTAEGEWLMQVNLTPADVGWLNVQTDFSAEYWS